MAAITTSPASNAYVGQKVAIAGTGWGTDPVVITSTDFVVTLIPDTGAISGFEFAPTKEGVTVISADDGTDQASASLRVWST
jgi:hypothetical protein